ncbi:PKIP [Spodoptera cosmioides nucleopolyhedrovirus]|uniref:PKIP n=1 Tax=Spodoptera cosmioides nucleopolyhedrovirus TaxID=2605774 RepID=A0A6B7KH54_9ABAC|nr:PKIP [Spodoptera cosmioides nucleopolyhedrovirus]
MQNQITALTQKEFNLKTQYENKVVSILKKGKIDENTRNEMIIMIAEQFGIEEQLYSLNRYGNSTEKRRKDFINNLNELDFSNYEIEEMLDAADAEHCDFLMKKYKISESAKPESIQKTFEKNSKKFIKILKQFVEKRNAYRKDENSSLLDELVLLKCNLIKHLCIMEKLLIVEENKK